MKIVSNKAFEMDLNKAKVCQYNFIATNFCEQNFNVGKYEKTENKEQENLPKPCLPYTPHHGSHTSIDTLPKSCRRAPLPSLRPVSCASPIHFPRILITFLLTHGRQVKSQHQLTVLEKLEKFSHEIIKHSR